MNRLLLLQVHVTFFFLLFSPFFLSRKIQEKYGYLIMLLYITIFSWIVLGQCPLNKIQNYKIRFSYNILRYYWFNAKPYNNTILFFQDTYIYCYIYYSHLKKFTNATILLFIIYYQNILAKMKRYFRCN